MNKKLMIQLQRDRLINIQQGIKKGSLSFVDMKWLVETLDTYIKEEEENFNEPVNPKSHMRRRLLSHHG